MGGLELSGGELIEGGGGRGAGHGLRSGLGGCNRVAVRVDLVQVVVGLEVCIRTCSPISSTRRRCRRGRKERIVDAPSSSPAPSPSRISTASLELSSMILASSPILLILDANESRNECRLAAARESSSSWRYAVQSRISSIRIPLVGKSAEWRGSEEDEISKKRTLTSPQFPLRLLNLPQMLFHSIILRFLIPNLDQPIDQNLPVADDGSQRRFPRENVLQRGAI